MSGHTGHHTSTGLCLLQDQLQLSRKAKGQCRMLHIPPLRSLSTHAHARASAAQCCTRSVSQSPAPHTRTRRNQHWTPAGAVLHHTTSQPCNFSGGVNQHIHKEPIPQRVPVKGAATTATTNPHNASSQLAGCPQPHNRGAGPQPCAQIITAHLPACNHSWSLPAYLPCLNPSCHKPHQP